MVDQIRAWLDLIPPEERKRWEWLDDPTTWGGMSRTIDTPVGQVYNPLAAAPDLLGVLGTAVRDPLQANLVEPALGAATYASQLLPSTRPDLGRRKFFSDEPEVPLQGTDFARYWRENRPTGGLGGAAADVVQDPTSYVGGPLAEGARLAARVPGLARLALPVARADELYSEKMGQLVGGAIGQTAGLARRIPGVGPWLADSPQKAIALFGGGLRRAVDDPLAADRLESLVSGSKIGLTGQHVDWEKTIRPAWVAIDTAIGEAAHPLQKAALVQQRAKALELENVLEARFEQHRIALEEGIQAGEISGREFQRETRDLWQLQARSVRALQLGLIDSINAVKGLGDEALAGMAGQVDEAGEAIAPSLYDVLGRVGDDDVLGGTLTTALQRASDEALAARDMGIAIKGGTSGVDKVEGLFSMKMGEGGDRIGALQAQDPFYRQAREAAIKELNEAADAVFARYADVADPADVATLDDTMRSAFQAAENELAPFTQTPEQALAGLGESKRNAILKVWDTDSNVSLPKQMRRVLNARRALTEQVSPTLHQWYREMGHSLEQRNAAVEAALSSADNLLKEPALLAPEAAALRTEVITRLNKFGHSGDILVAGDAPKVAANLTTSAYARALGIKAPHPLLGAAATQLGAWKEQAVLSPAFQLANLLGGLVLGEAGGVSGVRVLNLLRHTLPQMKGVIFQGKPIDLVVDGATSKMFSQIFGDAAGRIHFTEELVGRSSGAGLEVTGLVSGPAATASGRIPLVLRAGVPALATGGGYWAQNPDDPDRARNALIVGGAAGAFGAATPRFVFYNQNLSAASEGAMRGAALFTGAEEAIGSVSKGGIAKVFHDTKIEAALGKPTRVTSVGKELTRSDMLPGLDTVSGMQTLSPLLPEPKGGILPPLGATADEAAAARTAWTGPPPEGPVLPPLGAMTPEEMATIGYQRWDEPGTGRLTVNRPQGLYTTPASVTSPHAYLGEQQLWRRAPDLNVLPVEFNEGRLGAGRAALHAMLGNDEYYQVVALSADDMLARVHAEFPGQIDMAQFGPNYDKWDVVEAWAGLEARKRGYDAIELVDPARPEYSEFVALTERALTPAGPPPAAPPPPAAEQPPLLPPLEGPPVPPAPPAAPPPPAAPIGPRFATPADAQARMTELRQQADAAAAAHPDLAPHDAKIARAQKKYEAARAAESAYTSTGTIKTDPQILTLQNARKAARNAVEKAEQAKSADASRLANGELYEIVSRLDVDERAALEAADVGIPERAWPEVWQIPQAQFLRRPWDRPGVMLAPEATLPDPEELLRLRQIPIANRTAEERLAYAEAFDAYRSATKAATHRANVEAALAAGKPVPENVLADYPDLAAAAPLGAPAPPAEAPPPTAAALPEEPPLLEVAPPDTLASRVIGLRRTGPSPVATAGGQTDIEAVKAAFAEVDGWMSADALEQVALRHGATAEEAARLRADWDQDTTTGYRAGIKLANDIHFDYSDINKLTAGLRDTGIAPFITWQTKALPRFATLLLQNPRFLVAIDGLNNLSEADAEEAGLTSRYARLVKMGVLGDVLAEQLLGRSGGTVLGAPLKALFPYADVGREGTLPENANPIERALAELRPLGLGPGPVVTLPLMAAGATGELPVDLYRTSPYLRALSTQLTGREADPELLTKHIMRAARGVVGAGVEPTVTGDFLRDRAIRQRIAEIAVEETGKPPAGPYLLAMDDPASQIWLRARAQVDRQRMGEQAGLSAVLPFRTKFLSDTEAEIRRVREQTGVGPEATAARRTQPATAAELAVAQADIRKKPLKAGETLEDRAATTRWIGAENAAAMANPLARTLNNLGGSQALARQFPEYLALQRRIKHMSPKRRGQLLAEFLGPREALRTYLAQNNIYG